MAAPAPLEPPNPHRYVSTVPANAKNIEALRKQQGEEKKLTCAICWNEIHPSSNGNVAFHDSYRRTKDVFHAACLENHDYCPKCGMNLLQTATPIKGVSSAHPPTAVQQAGEVMDVLKARRLSFLDFLKQEYHNYIQSNTPYDVNLHQMPENKREEYLSRFRQEQGFLSDREVEENFDFLEKLRFFGNYFRDPIAPFPDQKQGDHYAFAEILDLVHIYPAIDLEFLRQFSSQALGSDERKKMILDAYGRAEMSGDPLWKEVAKALVKIVGRRRLLDYREAKPLFDLAIDNSDFAFAKKIASLPGVDRQLSYTDTLLRICSSNEPITPAAYEFIETVLMREKENFRYAKNTVQQAFGKVLGKAHLPLLQLFLERADTCLTIEEMARGLIILLTAAAEKKSLDNTLGEIASSVLTFLSYRLQSHIQEGKQATEDFFCTIILMLAPKNLSREQKQRFEEILRSTPLSPEKPGELLVGLIKEGHIDLAQALAERHLREIQPYKEKAIAVASFFDSRAVRKLFE